jgi:hypothetical protein
VYTHSVYHKAESFTSKHVSLVYDSFLEALAGKEPFTRAHDGGLFASLSLVFYAYCGTLACRTLSYCPHNGTQSFRQSQMADCAMHNPEWAAIIRLLKQLTNEQTTNESKSRIQPET